MENERMGDADSGNATYSGMPKKGSKKKLIVIIIVIIAVGGALFFMKGKFIAASVNGSFISRASVIRELEKKSGKDLLNVLITQKLIMQAADEQDITVTDEEIAAKVKEVESQIAAQGGKLEEVLAAQGMTLDTLHEQLVIQMRVEKLIGDKVTVTDEEVAAYIKDNKVKLEKGKEADIKARIKEQLRGGKMNQEASALVESLRTKANITYYGNYGK